MQGGSSGKTTVKESFSYSNKSSRTETSRGGGLAGGSFSGDHHDRVVVEDTTIRKTDYGSGLNSVDNRRRKPEDGYRRRQFGGVAGDTEDDYSSSRRYYGGDGRYQERTGVTESRGTESSAHSESRYGGGHSSASIDRRGYQAGSAGRRVDGASGEELERRYGAGQGFRTGSFDSQSGGGRYQAGGGLRRQYDADGSEYDSEYEGAAGGRGRRPPGGRRRGYYRRRRPIGGSTGGNQSYTYRRQYESRLPLSSDGLGSGDLASRRDELSGRRVQGGEERVERLEDGTRRTYQAHRELADGGGFERELTTEEERRTRREIGVRRRREREMVVVPEAVTSASGEVQQVVFFVSDAPTGRNRSGRGGILGS